MAELLIAHGKKSVISVDVGDFSVHLFLIVRIRATVAVRLKLDGPSDVDFRLGDPDLHPAHPLSCPAR